VTRRAGLLQLAMSGPAPSAADVAAVLAHHKANFGDARMDDDKDKPPAGPPKTFTQDDVTRVAAREKSEGERAGRKALLEQLGLPADTKPEDLKARLDAITAAEDAQKTEATKAKDAAELAKRESDREKQTAAAERHQAAVERHLLRAGVGGGESDDAKLAKAIDRASKLVEVEAGADSEKIAAAVADLKKDMPELFTAAKTDGKQPDGDAAAKTRKAGDGQKSGVARGREKAAELGWTKQKTA